MRRLRALAALLLSLAVVAGLAACTGVPTSSAPQVVKSLPVGGAAQQQNPITPTPGAAPPQLMQSFLEANVLDAGHHSSARTFLTTAARSRWNDTTATIVDATSIGSYVAGRPQIVVRGRVLGTLDANGEYTPALQGSSAPEVDFVYGIAQVQGQYRISSLRNGVLISEKQFLTSYTQRSLYFFDLAQRYLVPDPRWTSITDPTQLCDWLLNSLANGPSDFLSNAVTSENFPTEATTRTITVTFGSPTKIEIPGASQLDGATRDRLAAQVAETLSDVVRVAPIIITDGGVGVTIPGVSSKEFTSTEFDQTIITPPAAEVYYLRNGRVMAGSGHELPGAVNNGRYFLQSIAASRSDLVNSLLLAGVATIDNSPTLLVGSQVGGMKATTVHGVTSRPAFAPGRDEVWVGAGTTIMMVDPNATGGFTATPVALPTSAPTSGKIVALRLSPEGSRIALVISDPTGHQQLYVGAVVRVGGQVRVDTLQQLSPAGVVVTDLAWVERLKLYAIGYDTPSGAPRIYSVGVDGSAFQAQGIGELPDPPTTLSIALGQAGWVTSSNAVYEQSGGSTWSSPGPGTRTPGEAPVYLE